MTDDSWAWETACPLLTKKPMERMNINELREVLNFMGKGYYPKKTAAILFPKRHSGHILDTLFMRAWIMNRITYLRIMTGDIPIHRSHDNGTVTSRVAVAKVYRRICYELVRRLQPKAKDFISWRWRNMGGK